jgi:hypothetical protein
MKVYVLLFEIPYEGIDIVGVYPDISKAVNAAYLKADATYSESKFKKGEFRGIVKFRLECDYGDYIVQEFTMEDL